MGLSNWFQRILSAPETASGQNDEQQDLLLQKRVREIHIRSKRAVNDVMAGEYQSAFKGRGMEFDMVREYQEGDEPRLIDWNVTARMGHPYVRSYIEERELTILFLVDVSASLFFGSQGRNKREIAAELCAMLAFSAIKKNDKVGLLLFSDIIELYLPPKKGKTHVLRIIRELLVFTPKRRETSIQKALESFLKANRKRSVVFLVSDFLDRDYYQQLNLTNRRHEVVAVDIYDPHEQMPPQIGLIAVEDLETGKRTLVDTSDRSWRIRYQQIREQFETEKQATLRKFKIDPLPISTQGSVESELIRFFKRRGAQ